MDIDKKVVVVANMTLYNRTDGVEVVAARFKELGLTAYGRNEREAILACKKLFSRFVRIHREHGELEDRLNDFGVEWYWEDEYPTDHPAYEDTTRLMESPQTVWTQREQQPGRRFLIAA